MSSPPDIAQKAESVQATALAPPAPGRREKRGSWFREHRLAAIGLLIFLIVAAVVGFWVWSYYSIRETTDDARIDGYVAPVSARVSGHVLEILVDENVEVKAGQVLARIDQRDYEIALERAEADLNAQQAMARAARTQVPIESTSSSSNVSAAQAGLLEANAGVAAAIQNIANTNARLKAAEAGLRQATANRDRVLQDLERYKALVEKDEIPRQQYDTQASMARAVQAEVESAEAAIAQARAAIDVAESQAKQAQARVESAKAAVAASGSAPERIAVSRAQANNEEAVIGVRKAAADQAKLNLDYTIVRSPITGLVGRRSVQLGQNVSPGQPLFSVVDTSNMWVTANYKETQLDHMRPGQPASVEVDAFGGEKLKAHVDSIGAATGGTFSLLPPDNSSGNYVKVVQRVPVKIVFEKGQELVKRVRPGMSVVPTVITK